MRSMSCTSCTHTRVRAQNHCNVKSLLATRARRKHRAGAGQRHIGCCTTSTSTRAATASSHCRNARGSHHLYAAAAAPAPQHARHCCASTHQECRAGNGAHHSAGDRTTTLVVTLGCNTSRPINGNTPTCAVTTITRTASPGQYDVFKSPVVCRTTIPGIPAKGWLPDC